MRALKRKTSNLEIVRSIFRHYDAAQGDALFERIDWVDGDVNDVCGLDDAMTGVSYVYHCAAVVSFDQRDAALMEKINVEGTANVVNIAIAHDVKKFCHVSSTAAIGKNGAQEEHLDESAKWQNGKGNSAYSLSKYSAEQEVWRGTQEGLNAVIVNPSIILGPGNWAQSSGSMFKTVWDGLKYYTEGVNGFVDARDVARAMTTLMESDINAERFLVVGENRSFREVFEAIAVSLKKPKPTKLASPFLMGLAWRVLALVRWITGKAPAITKDSARSSQQRYYYATDKLTQAVEFTFTSVEDAAANAGAYYLSTQQS